MNVPYEEDYLVGFRAGVPTEGASSSWIRGWEDGNSDRPSLDELTCDAADEVRDPFGY